MPFTPLASPSMTAYGPMLTQAILSSPDLPDWARDKIMAAQGRTYVEQLVYGMEALWGARAHLSDAAWLSLAQMAYAVRADRLYTQGKSAAEGGDGRAQAILDYAKWVLDGGDEPAAPEGLEGWRDPALDEPTPPLPLPEA